MTAAHASAYPAAGPPGWRPGDLPVYRGGGGAIALLESASGALGRLTLSRASTGTYVDGAGTMRSAANDAPRFDWTHNGEIWVLRGLLREVQRQNKCTNTNAAPTDTTNVTKSGDAAATLSVVDDSAALSAAGLGAIGNGKAYRLDNSAGVSNAFATIAGQTGNTNPHSLSAWVRGGSGAVGLDGQSGEAFGASSAYQKVVQGNVTPGAATRQLAVTALAGESVTFVLNQLEEGAYATSTIVVAGAAATRAEDFVGSADLSWLEQPMDGRFDLVLTPMGSLPGGLSAVLDISAGSYGNRVAVYQKTGSLEVNRKVKTGNVNQTDGGTVSRLVAGVESELQLQIAKDDVQLAIDDAAGATATSVEIPEVNQLQVGTQFDDGNSNSLWIKSLHWTPGARIAA